MKSPLTHAFTLVELIVVITILAILGTIGFVSLQGYSVNARDSVRIADTKTFLKALNIYQTKEGQVPLPDDMTTITGSGVVFSYQGTLSGSVITALKQGAVPLDPTLGEPYLYATNEGRTKFQLLSYHERNTSSLDLTGDMTFAATSYADMYPKVIGDEIGIILNNDKSPHQSLDIDLDDTGTLTGKILIYSSEYIFENTSDFFDVLNLGISESCKEILDNSKTPLNSGEYTLYLENTGSLQAYCDMEFEGGGWTKILDEDESSGENRTLAFVEVGDIGERYSIYNYGVHYNNFHTKTLPSHNEVYIPNYCLYPTHWRQSGNYISSTGEHIKLFDEGENNLGDIAVVDFPYFQRDSNFSVSCSSYYSQGVFYSEGEEGICVNSYAKGIIKGKPIASNTNKAFYTIPFNSTSYSTVFGCEIWIR